MLNDVVNTLAAAWDHEVAALSGKVSIHLRTLDEAVVGRHADSPHYAASTMKMAVLVAALGERFGGRLDLSKEVEIRSTFKSAIGGSFTMRQDDDQDDATWNRLGNRVRIATLLERMIVDSSNIATNIVIEEIGFDAVRQVFGRANAEAMAVNRFIGDEAAEAAGITNTVTAFDLAQLLASLAAGGLLPPKGTDVAVGLLTRQMYRRMLPAGLPEGTWSAGKAGWNPAVKHDVALVRPRGAPAYVLAVCTTSGLEEQAEQLVARLSAITWAHWTSAHGG